MSDKTRFMFLIRPDERQTLKQLAKTFDRSEGATVRLLIRNAAQVLAEFPLAAHEEPILMEKQTSVEGGNCVKPR